MTKKLLSRLQPLTDRRGERILFLGILFLGNLCLPNEPIVNSELSKVTVEVFNFLSFSHERKNCLLHTTSCRRRYQLQFAGRVHLRKKFRDFIFYRGKFNNCSILGNCVDKSVLSVVQQKFK